MTIRCRTLSAFLQTLATPVLWKQCLSGTLPEQFTLLRIRNVRRAMNTVALDVHSPVIEVLAENCRLACLDLRPVKVVCSASSNVVLSWYPTLVTPVRTTRNELTVALKVPCLCVQVMVVLQVVCDRLMVRVVTLTWLVLSMFTVTPKLLFLVLTRLLVGTMQLRNLTL